MRTQKLFALQKLPSVRLLVFGGKSCPGAIRTSGKEKEISSCQRKFDSVGNFDLGDLGPVGRGRDFELGVLGWAGLGEFGLGEIRSGGAGRD